MNEVIANLVHPVLSYGLQLRERLDKGPPPALDAEQAILKTLLLTDLEASKYLDFGSEYDREALLPQNPLLDEEPRDGYFLGARYALVCWLDEIFIRDSVWETDWNERKLEAALYGSNDRAWKFWEQAAHAEKLTRGDALEVFYLCVMLGFRGDLVEDTVKLLSWCAATQTRLTRDGQEWPQPPALDPPTDVAPMRGREQMRRMLYWLCMAILAAIPLAAFLLVQHMSE